MAQTNERDRLRSELHDIIDKIIDGPGSSSDRDAINALIGIGKIIAAALWALEYEMGRVKAGRWRSRSNLLLSNYDLPEGARKELISWLGLEPEEEREFMEQGRGPGTVDEERLLMATVMAAFAMGSQDERIAALARGLAALNQGEALPLLTPRRSARARGGHGHPDAITTHRLTALLEIEYQHEAGAFPSVQAARRRIAEFYGVEPEAMVKWPGLVAKAIGARRLRDERDAARFCAAVIGVCKASGWKLAQAFVQGAEEAFGLTALQASGKRFQKQRRGSKA